MTLPRSPSFSLDGKSALVTGASSGIGLGAAAALADAGAEVLLVARRIEELEAVRDAIRATGEIFRGWSRTAQSCYCVGRRE